MTMALCEFTDTFFQDILLESDAVEEFTGDVFFEKFCGHLVDAGEIDDADRAVYRGPRGTGIQVDGFGGDPVDNESDTLSLIISDFNQSSKVKRLTGSEMNRIFQRLSNFLKKSLDPKWRNALEETSAAFGLADLISHRWSRIDKVRLFLISNRELSERVDGREAEEFDGRTITYSVWDIKRLHRFVTIGHGREDIDIDLEKDFGGAIPVLPAQNSETVHESYLAVMPGQVLANIYDRWGARLLEQNVRVFLQARGKVNKGIRITLENEPSMFFSYNNGITATAEAVTIASLDGHRMMRQIRNFQIVNGGQTTASIHVAHRNKVDLSETFVQMKLSVIDSEQTDEVVPKISEFANTQNRVNAADFFSNHPFHVRIEEFSRRMHAPSPDGTFRQTKWFYERARGQYADARALLSRAERRKFDLENPRSQLFSKTDLAKFLNVWLGRPHTVSLGAQKNFVYFAEKVSRDWEKDRDRFNEAWYREAVAKRIIFKATERIVSNQPWYQGGYRANIVAYAIAKMAYDLSEMGKMVDFEAIWQRQALSATLETALAKVAREVDKILTEPPAGIRNVTEWAKKQACWDRASQLKVKWPKGLSDDLLSTEEVKEGKRRARRDQKLLNGIEAQTAVVNAGGPFWVAALNWGRERDLLSPADIGVLGVAAEIPVKLPTEAQSARAVKALSKLQGEGYEGRLHS